MLSKSQKLLLAQLVRENKTLLFGPFSPTVTNKAKQSCWEMIRRALQETGCEPTDVKTLGDTEWRNLKRSVQNKYQDSMRTGAAGTTFSELDEVVLAVIGRDSPNLKPVDVKDSEVIFQGASESDLGSVMVPISDSPVPPDVRVIFGDGSSAGELGDNVMQLKRKTETQKKRGHSGIDEELVELRKERTRLEIVKLKLEIAQLRREENMLLPN
jgi:hypothetical protein